MRRPNLDRVEIVEPPIGELTKKRYGFKRTCLTGCSCIFIFLLAIVIGVRLFIGPGPKSLKAVPENFPSDIPIYDKDHVEQITFISGKYKSRGLEIAAVVPKVILSPLFKKKETRGKEEASKRFWSVLTMPVADTRNTVQIEWRELDAEPSFVISYYQTELQKSGYQITDEVTGQDFKQFSFHKPNGVGGTLLVDGNEETRAGTEYAVLTVNLP